MVKWIKTTHPNVQAAAPVAPVFQALGGSVCDMLMVVLPNIDAFGIGVGMVCGLPTVMIRYAWPMLAP